MERWMGKIAVVTGASSGIGLATVKALFSEGMTVIGLARRKTLMENEMKNITGKGKFYPMKCDVSSEQSVLDTFQWIKENFATIHVLVNNAGLVLNGKIVETERTVWEKVFNLNVMGLLQCSQQTLRLMKEADVEGHIININSIHGHRVYTIENHNFNIYPATKYAVTAITEILQNESFGEKIKFTSISPGYVKTDILKNGDLAVDVSQWPSLKSEDIANAIVYVISTPPHVQITELSLSVLGEKMKS